MTVEQVVPILNVTDVEASVAWFGKLGWNKGFDWRGTPGGPVDFGAVTAGDNEIFLCRDGQGGRGDKGVWMSIWVDDVDAVHERALAAGPGDHAPADRRAVERARVPRPPPRRSRVPHQPRERSA